MSGTTVSWARGAWVLAFTNGYPQKPPLLLCPKATDRRGPGAAETLVAPTSPNAVAWGGPRSAYDFPIPDPANPALPLIASYGVNCWIYNRDTNNVQGRIAQYHWRKYGSPAQPSVTPLFLDSMWRGTGPDSTDTPPSFNGQEVLAAAGEMSYVAIARHGKGVNIANFDGSVNNVRAKGLWGLPWHRNYVAATNLVFPSWMD
jgi:prepilin-type processing-associated H-X9-DG protein